MPTRSVPTVSSLTRQGRRLDRRNAKVERVLTCMQRGATLHCQFEYGRPIWWLSDRSHVSADVAKVVVADLRVIGVGDSLLVGVPAQTYRFSEDA
jgi:hypothetical protein